MCRRRLLGGWFLLGVLLAPPVWAQGSLPPLPPEVKPLEVQGAGADKYVGVAPGAHTKNPLPRPGRQPVHLIWSGVQRAGEGLRVFFQTTREVTFDLSSEASSDKAAKVAKPANGSELSVFLRNCRIHLRNNGRRLDTRFFPGPVAAVTAHQRRRDVELRIVLKEPAQPVTRVEPGPDGTQFLVVEFAATATAGAAATSPGVTK